MEQQVDDQWKHCHVFAFAQRAQRLAALQCESDPTRRISEVCKVLFTVPKCGSRQEQCCVADIIRRVAAVFYVSPGTAKDAPLVARLSRTSAGDVHVARAVTYAIHRFNDPHLTLQSAARVCRLSSPHLSNVVSEKTGVHFTVQKLVLRFLYAAHLLVTTPLTIKEIAYASGYADGSVIDHEFKRWIHMTPGEFRQLASPIDEA